MLDKQNLVIQDGFFQSMLNSREYHLYMRNQITPSMKYELKNIPIRFFLYMYIFSKPGSTQADFAAELSISPMSLSRAVSQDAPVREEWIDQILMIFSKIGTDFARVYTNSFFSQMDKVHLSDERFTLFYLVCEYLKQKHNDKMDYLLEDFDGTKSFCLCNQHSGDRWLYFDFDSFINKSGKPSSLLPFVAIEEMCKSAGISKITMFTESTSVFEQLIGKYIVQIGSDQELKSNRYRSIMYLCSMEPEYITEYILTQDTSKTAF